ncbi:hypothetical protein [Legionella busanensis]|nr:hypothetical protein [Legionella busanensis]
MSGSSSDNNIVELLKNIYEAKTIYTQFDKLTELLNFLENNKLEGAIYTELNTSILAVIGHIINEDDEVKIREKVTAREKIKKFDPYYMPWIRPEPGDLSNDLFALFQSVKQQSDADIKSTFATFFKKLKSSKNLLKLGGRNKSEDDFWAYRQESDIEEAHYNLEELEQFRVIPYQGKLLKLTNIENGENKRLTFEYASTKHLTLKAFDDFFKRSQDYPKRGIYTIHINGSMFVGPSLAPQRTSIFFNPKAILHPSFSDSYARIPLFMAGQIEIEQGEAGLLDSGSGHYLPDYEQTQLANLFFKVIGIISNRTKLTFFRLIDQERVFDADFNCTELEALIKDFCLINKIDPRIVTLDYLGTAAPSLYTHYKMQAQINNELVLWQKESFVFFSTLSVQTLKLNQEIEKFSKYGQYTNPEYTCDLLLNIQKAIDEWNRYHQQSKITSKRQSAVNNLEKRVQQQLIYYTTKLLLRNLSEEPMPEPQQKWVKQFLKGKMDIAKAAQEIAAFKNKEISFHKSWPNETPELAEGSISNRLTTVASGRPFFSANSIQKSNPIISAIFELIIKSEQASLKALKKINASLAKVLIESEKPTKQIFLG